MSLGQVGLRVCCLALGLMPLAAAQGGVVEIGPLHPYVPGGVTPGIEGLAFDGHGGPLVLDSWAWTLSRVSLVDASVQSVATSNPLPSSYNAQLVFDSAAGNYYTTTGNMSLVRIDGGSLNHTTVGSIGVFFNFAALGAGPGNSLYLATDRNGGELWTVDKATGVGTVATAITFPADPSELSRQVTAMATDPAGQIFVAARSPYGYDERIYLVDPVTGAASVVGSTGFGAFDFLDALSYDPVTGAFYGIHEHRSMTDPYTYSLVRVTGVVPEPASVAVVGGMALPVVLGRRRRGSRAD